MFEAANYIFMRVVQIKPVHVAASKCGWLQMIMWLCKTHQQLTMRCATEQVH